MSERAAPYRGAKSARLDLRVSEAQKTLLEEAAAYEGRTVTDFVLQAASVAAQNALADRTHFVLSAEAWAAFTEALDRQPRYLPWLAKLLSEPSVLDHE